MRAFVVSMCVVLVPACVSTDPETPASHPANASVAGPRSDHDTAVLRAGFDPFERYEGSAADAGAVPQGHESHSAHQAHEPSASEPSGPSAPSDGGATPAAASYTCPMHPEIVRPEPGRCPKCGMKLVPKKSESK
jgi:hypothetical protein